MISERDRPAASGRRGRGRRGNRRTLGQNFLRDRDAVAAVVNQIGPPGSQVVELGAGDGAVTAELVRRGHDVTAVELDPRWARTLRRRFDISVVQGDMLQFRFPREPHRVVSNVPYSITTALLRRLFEERAWTVAVLLVQWEVARKRAGHGTLVTASWSPWYEVELVRRIPARGFRPVPQVDGGLIRLTRRPEPLVSDAERRAYQRFVASVFAGRGVGLEGVLLPYLTRLQLRRWAAARHARDALLPRDLNAYQWASLFRVIHGSRE